MLVAFASLTVASLVGGWCAGAKGLSHRTMQVLLSFVAGLLGALASLVLLPEAAAHGLGMPAAMAWATGGFVGIVVLERMVCFHHHETSLEADETGCCSHGHGARLATLAAFAGLAVHGAMAGLALGMAIAGEADALWPGGALLLAIVLHKPFDGLTVVAVARRDGLAPSRQHLLNMAYALVTPVAVGLGFFGVGQLPEVATSAALALAAGMLLALALGDLLPEVQRHDHDRLLLTAALLLGVAAAVGVGALHSIGHTHDHGAPGHVHTADCEHDHAHDHGHDHAH